MDVSIPKTNATMTRCEDRVLVFCAISPFHVEFDRPGIRLAREKPETITECQVELMNKAMGARSPWNAWEKLRLDDLRELSDLEEADLIEMSDAKWAVQRPLLEELYRRLMQKGIGATAATKIAYLHRPRLIAMADAKVSSFFCCEKDPHVHRAMKVAEGIREIGRHRGNLEALTAIQASLMERIIDCKPVEMSKVRILDALIWMSLDEAFKRLWHVLEWGPLCVAGPSS